MQAMVGPAGTGVVKPGTPGLLQSQVKKLTDLMRKMVKETLAVSGVSYCLLWVMV